MTANESSTQTPEAVDSESARTKVVALAAGTGAAVAGIAGGIALAARDSRKRVLGVPVGRRTTLERGATAVVEKVQEPVKKVGSRFARPN